MPASKPAPVAEPAPVSVAPSEVSEFLKKGVPEKPAEQASASLQPTPSAAAVALATELHTLRTQASVLMLVWADQQETRCRQRIYGVCLGEHRVLISRGVENYVRRALIPYDDGSQEAETLTISGAVYTVNPSKYQAKVAIVKELEAVLAKASPADAGNLVEGWAALRQEREAPRAEKLRAAQKDAAAAQRAYKVAVASRQETRMWSLWSALLALGALVLLGLVLAVLAIERHTRMLDQSTRAALASVTSQTAAVSGT